MFKISGNGHIAKMCKGEEMCTCGVYNADNSCAVAAKASTMGQVGVVTKHEAEIKPYMYKSDEICRKAGK